jgi:hypothetical protein
MSVVRENGKKEVFGFSTNYTSDCGMWVCASLFHGRGRELRVGQHGFKASTVLAC